MDEQNRGAGDPTGPPAWPPSPPSGTPPGPPAWPPVGPPSGLPPAGARGVVHPLEVGRAFGAGWRLFTARWRAHLAVLIALLGPAYAVNALWVLAYGEAFQRWGAEMQAAQVAGRPLDLGDLPILPVDGILILVAVNLALAIVGVLGTAAVINLHGWTYGGADTTAGRALRAAARRWGTLIGASLLFALAILAIVMVGLFAGFILLTAAGPQGGVAGLLALIVIVATVATALFVMLRWVFMIHAVALEDRGAVEALARSWRLVSGSTWRVLGYLLLLVLVFLVAGLVVGIVQAIIFGLGFDPLTGELWPFDPARAIGSLVLQVALSVALTPYYLAILTLLYYDLRWRRGEMLQPPPG